MLNGRDHPAARKSIAVNGRGTVATTAGETETSAFYGDYERELASQLAELLRATPGARVGQAQVALDAGLSPPAVASLPPPPTGRAFVAASRPDNDFARAVAGDQPLPLSWRHEARAQEPGWMTRQLRAGLVGLGAGLLVVLPAVAVLSGRLDPWLPPAIKAMAVSQAGERPVAQRPAAEPQRPAVSAVAVVSPTTAGPSVSVAEERVAVPVAAPVAVPVRTVAVVPPSPPVQVAAAVSSDAAPATAAAAETTRSIASVDSFPAALPRAQLPVVAPSVPTPAEEAASLLALGRKLVKDGDISSARGPLARAANFGSPEAMLALGETFDPIMLAAWGAREVKADASTARLFYSRAVSAGLTQAKQRLEALN